MSVARVATWDEPPDLREDDDRRARSLFDLLQSLPGFIAGHYLREATTGRLMSVTLWESEAMLEAAEQAVAERPVGDQRGIRPRGSSAGSSTPASSCLLERACG